MNETGISEKVKIALMAGQVNVTTDVIRDTIQSMSVESGFILW